MSDNKYIVTEILNTDSINTTLNCLEIDSDLVFDVRREVKGVFGVKGLQIGDIVDIQPDIGFKKKRYTNAEPAIVTGSTIRKEPGLGGNILNFVTAFCAKYGDIIIRLDSILDCPNPYIYTQRGDEILIQKTAKGYKILTNKTVDKLRSDFLQRQR